MIIKGVAMEKKLNTMRSVFLPSLMAGIIAFSLSVSAQNVNYLASDTQSDTLTENVSETMTNTPNYNKVSVKSSSQGHNNVSVFSSSSTTNNQQGSGWSVSLNSQSLAANEMNISLTVRNERGEPVSGADIKAAFLHNGKDGKDFVLKESGPGFYNAHIIFPEKGTWQGHIVIEHEGKLVNHQNINISRNVQ
jgi:hypothetical protein